MRADGSAPRRVLTERSESWVNRPPEPHWLSDGSFLWESERTGYNHLYRMARSGELLGAVTSGEWQVRSILRIDEERGQVWFEGTRDGAVNRNVYRAGWDGAEPVRLTRGQGDPRGAALRGRVAVPRPLLRGRPRPRGPLVRRGVGRGAARGLRGRARPGPALGQHPPVRGPCARRVPARLHADRSRGLRMGRTAGRRPSAGLPGDVLGPGRTHRTQRVAAVGVAPVPLRTGVPRPALQRAQRFGQGAGAHGNLLPGGSASRSSATSRTPSLGRWRSTVATRRGWRSRAGATAASWRATR